MKHDKPSKLSRIRHGFAVATACVVVLGVPVLSLTQFGHFHVWDSRSAAQLPTFQTRAVDKSSAPVQLFRQPLISVTFDDGDESTYQGAFPILQQHGIRTTQYILSGVENNSYYLSWAQVKQVQKAGHEIACHTINHPDLTTISNQDVMRQLTGCKTTMQQELGVQVTDFASPYGSEDAQTLSDTKKVYASQRNVNGDPTHAANNSNVNLAKYFDPNDIIGVTVTKNTSIAELDRLVTYAEQNNGWVVLVYHQADGEPSKYALNAKVLNQQMSYLEHTPVRIVTVHQAISSLKTPINATKESSIQ